MQAGSKYEHTQTTSVAIEVVEIKYPKGKEDMSESDMCDLEDWLKRKAIEVGYGKHREYFSLDRPENLDVEVLFTVKYK